MTYPSKFITAHPVKSLTPPIKIKDYYIIKYEIDQTLSLFG